MPIDFQDIFPTSIRVEWNLSLKKKKKKIKQNKVVYQLTERKKWMTTFFGMPAWATRPVRIFSSSHYYYMYYERPVSSDVTSFRKWLFSRSFFPGHFMSAVSWHLGALAAKLLSYFFRVIVTHSPATVILPLFFCLFLLECDSVKKWGYADLIAEEIKKYRSFWKCVYLLVF